MCRGEVDWRIDCLLADRLHLLHDLRSMLWLLEVHALREELRQLVLLIDIHDAFTFADNLCPSLSDTAVCADMLLFANSSCVLNRCVVIARITIVHQYWPA